MTPLVCGVMVTHEPSPRVIDVLDSFRHQVAHVVIVDNASSTECHRLLANICDADPALTLISNDTNQWLAKALNQGSSWARSQGYEFVLMMNYGNLLSPNAVATMLQFFADPELGRVGSVNPRVVIGQRPEETAWEVAADESLPVTAGCLVSSDAIAVSGGQRETFLIDMIDYDFGFRLRTHGYRSLTAPSVTIACELGRTTRRRFGWKHCNVENYSPLRRYYYARNGLVLLREVRDIDLAWDYGYFLLASLGKILLYEDQKAIKLLMTLRGLRDALRGHLGPFASE